MSALVRNTTGHFTEKFTEILEGSDFDFCNSLVSNTLKQKYADLA